jgi:uncharacterized protein with von Willebrand factor type A (vWA) domain
VDGEFHGWLGGSCTKPTVVREAMRALSDGRPGLITSRRNPRRDPRYEPTARGMEAALPFVDLLAPAHNLESLERLLPMLAA